MQGAICYSKPVKDDEQIQSVHPGATVKEPGTVGEGYRNESAGKGQAS